VTTGGPLGYPRMAFESRAFTACSPAPGSPLVHGWSCNQLRREIGVVYGNPETTTGEQVVGNKTRVKSP
jgi:hypothetical protein